MDFLKSVKMAERSKWERHHHLLSVMSCANFKFEKTNGTTTQWKVHALKDLFH